MRVPILLLLCALALCAQGTTPDPNPGSPVMPRVLFPPDLQKFLELTNPQVDSIVRANTEFNVFAARKNMRSAQVQAEIRDWTNRDPIDAIQLGARYAELEQIRREIRDEEKKTVEKVRGVLNPVQTAKLNVLEEAAKLQPLISDAICEKLMTAPNPVPTGIIGGATSGSFVLGGVILPSPIPAFNCVRPVPSPLPPEPLPRM